ncbi:hypothetical protein GGE45_003957 [Rhizobium aethiopicum]|nr:hypothetical protein [Rhizobium aethiopicum]
MSGTATMKRSAVNIIGGMLPRPSLVIGIDSPHIRAKNNMAPKLLLESELGESTGAGMPTISEVWDILDSICLACA